MIPGYQRRAERAHDAGDIRADRLAAGDLFKAAKDRVVVEGAALHDNIFAERRGVGDFDYLKQRVLDDGVCQPRGDIGDGGTLLLRLFYLGVHKYRAAGAQVDRMFRKEGSFGKVLHAVV